LTAKKSKSKSPSNIGIEVLNQKKKIYIETTVASYLTARPSRDLLVAAGGPK
jgi:hypothetical protein